MITITFQSFFEGKWVDRDNERYELYVVRNHKDILYIGISQSDIWDRWFGGFGRMKKNAGGYWYSTDTIGRNIIENMPDSLNWSIELWTLEDCIKLFGDKIKKMGFSIERSDIKDYEKLMIQELWPELNTTYNYGN